jgi:parvulin-like peptidyl-prolyl isomerase
MSSSHKSSRKKIAIHKKLVPAFGALGVLPVALPAFAPTAFAQAPTRATAPPAAAPKPAAPPAAGSTPKPDAAPAPKPIPANITVAATVNDDKIMMADINAVIERIRQQQPNIPAADLDGMRREICEDMITERLLVQEARRQNLMPTKQQVDDAIWRYKKPFLSEAAYKKHLADNNKTEEDLRRILSDEMAVSALSRKLTADVVLPDDEVAKFYNEHKADFVVPEMVHVRHIQISVKNDASADVRNKARKRAEEALKKATNNNADFAALAKEYSDDKVSAPAGGDLGFIARDDVIDKAFGDAAFAAPVGKVNPKLVETKFGYNIIKVEEKKPSRTLALSEVAPLIKPRMLQNKLKERLDERVAELRKTANVKKNI